MSLIEIDEQERARRWREVWTIYLVMTLGTLFVDQIAIVWPFFASMSVLIVALGFIFLPTEYLLSRGESPRRFGIGGRTPSRLALTNQDHRFNVDHSDDLSQDWAESSTKRAWRCTRQALWISLLIFPFFVIGNHVWRGIQGQSPDFSARALSRWDESLRGLSNQNLKTGEIDFC